MTAQRDLLSFYWYPDISIICPNALCRLCGFMWPSNIWFFLLLLLWLSFGPIYLCWVIFAVNDSQVVDNEHEDILLLGSLYYKSSYLVRHIFTVTQSVVVDCGHQHTHILSSFSSKSTRKSKSHLKTRYKTLISMSLCWCCGWNIPDVETSGCIARD